MVKWPLPAKTNLKQIHDYIALGSRYYAKKVAQTIVEKTDNPTPGVLISKRLASSPSEIPNSLEIPLSCPVCR